MRAYDLIYKKRRGGELDTAEWAYLVEGYVRGAVPDYQMAALLMAVCFQGMTARETADLTLLMAESGEQVDLAAIAGVKVDKHSTGGVGDTTTLVLAPLVAVGGAPVAKMSGRGLGHTGGTLDKLESIPGFQVEQTPAQFAAQVGRIGCAVVSQSANLVPADKQLYALRDVTATVDSVPLIAASVMAKKIAGGADAIVLDVKTGRGAFMPKPEDAFTLAEAMVAIGARVGRRTVALVTDMEQPLGRAVGNALEVREAIWTLGGRGPADLTELCLALGAQMLELAGAAPDHATGAARLSQALADGSALRRFKEMVAAQGGDPRVVDDPDLLPTAPLQQPLLSPADGFVAAIDALAVGQASLDLGAGRSTKDDRIDPAAGVVLQVKVGDAVTAGMPLAVLHSHDRARLAAATRRLTDAFTVAAGPPPARPLIYGLVTADGRQYRR